MYYFYTYLHEIKIFAHSNFFKGLNIFNTWLQEAYKVTLVEEHGSKNETQPSFDPTMLMEATRGISKNKMYGFGLHTRSSSVLARTPTSCSTSQSDNPLRSTSTVYCPRSYGDYAEVYYRNFDEPST